MTTETTPAAPAPAPSPAPGPAGGNAEPAAPAPGGWQPPETQEQAQALLDSFRVDGEPAWVRNAYRNARHPGHAEAVERMQSIYRAANPAPGPSAVTRTDPATGIPVTVPLDAAGGAADEVPPDASGYDAALAAAIPDRLAGSIGTEERAQATGWAHALGLHRGEARELFGLLVGKAASMDALAREHALSPPGRASEIATERFQRQSAAAEKRLCQEWGDQYESRLAAANRMLREADAKVPGLLDALRATGLAGSYRAAVFLDRVARRRGIK